ncbi:O-antigen ligase family protein [Paenibacillus azoreducens]|uniref:O-antigen ligase family protein n=1 Tax=Paenibacillus azoreducens TaxID=116718 RepID=UPI001BB3ACF6|nr:O-antigen ligase family protein [Paenibacillus azoreducens]
MCGFAACGEAGIGCPNVDPAPGRGYNKVMGGKGVKRWVQGVGEAALIAVLLVACLKSGLYFTAGLYPVWIGYGSLILFAGVLALALRVFGREKHATAGAARPWPELVLIACPIILMAVYAVHWLLGPLSVQGTMNQLLRWGFYGLFAVSAISAARRQGGRAVLAAAWHAAGAVLCGSALLAVYGVIPLPYAIAYSANPGISATGARLAGLLEYPNTFGMLMAAFLLERLFALSALFRRESEAGQARLLRAAFPLLPYAAALLLSESRGAWLAAGVALAAGLALERRRMLAPLLLAAAPLAGAALLYRQLAAALLAVQPVPGLLALAGVWAGSMLAGLGLCRLARSEAAVRRRLAWGAGGLLAGAGAGMVFLTAQERIVRNFGTVSARGAMYRDAWRLFEHAPWFGQGGETWRLSYRAVQSNPYVGSQVHSGYLDMLLNTGIIGTCILLVLLAAAGWLLYRCRRCLLPVFLVFVLHSAADLDWSFGLVWLLMFLLVAWGLSCERAPLSSAEANSAAAGLEPHPELVRQRLWGLSREGMLPASGRVPLQLLWLGIIAGGVMLAIRGEAGYRLHQEAYYASSPAKAISLLRSSLRWNPADAAAALDLARFLQPEEARSVLERSLSYTPGHSGLIFALADNAIRRGDTAAAAQWAKVGFSSDKFNAGEQTRSLEGLFRLAKRKLSSGNAQEARRIVQAGLALYRDYANRAKDHYGASLRNDRDFRLTREAMEWGRQLTRLERTISETR